MREVKDAMAGVQSEIRQTMNETERSVMTPINKESEKKQDTSPKENKDAEEKLP